jgi:hypothetical protein
MVDREIIRDRKKRYGDNFSDIAEVWTEFLYQNKDGFADVITPREVCEMMALMKEVRVEATREILQNIYIDTESANGEEINLENSLIDSTTDRDNYRHIARNWQWYQNI